MTPPAHATWPRRREWMLIVGAWLTVGLLTGMEDVLDPRGGGPVVWGRLPGTIGEEMIESVLWIAVTPLAFWLARRFPLERAQAVRNAALHLGLAVGIAIAVDVAETVLHAGLLHADGRPAHATVVEIITRFWFTNELVVYFVVLAVGVARDNFLQKKRQQEEAKQLQARTRQLESQLTEARLETLRMQLNPHFLFNTLHAISTLVGRDPGGVRRMVTRLSELLRNVLDDEAPQETLLADEVAMLRDYLDIQQIRFQDRLSVSIHVPDALHDARVPYLILQPVAENAIKHGISRKRGDGRIQIRATRDGSDLVLTVRDDGPGLEDGAFTPGVGLRNVHERLHGLYGPDAGIRLRNAPTGSGATATLRLPYHTRPTRYAAAPRGDGLPEPDARADATVLTTSSPNHA